LLPKQVKGDPLTCGNGKPAGQRALSRTACRHVTEILLHVCCTAASRDLRKPELGDLIARRHPALDRFRRDGARQHYHVESVLPRIGLRDDACKEPETGAPVR
jgi:hypothetical protein